MSNFVEYDSAGNIVNEISAPNLETAKEIAQSENVIDGDGSYFSHYVQSGRLVAYTADQRHKKLSGYATHTDWSNSEMDWLDQPTTEHIANEVRFERDGLLQKTDWTQLPDVSDDIKLAYSEYRQALRDIPQQAGFPQNVIWPTKPE